MMYGIYQPRQIEYIDHYDILTPRDYKDDCEWAKYGTMVFFPDRKKAKDFLTFFKDSIQQILAEGKIVLNGEFFDMPKHKIPVIRKMAIEKFIKDEIDENKLPKREEFR